MSRSVFISYEYGRDKDFVNGIRGLIENPNIDITFYDKSVTQEINSTNESYIKSVILEKIKSASMLLCIVGEDTHSSPWVKWEIEKARENYKEVVFMRRKDYFNTSMPQGVLKNQSIWNWDINFLKSL